MTHRHSARAVALAVLLVVMLVPQQHAARADSPTAAPLAAPPRNVILMIADGTGFNHIDAASMYQYGQAGGQAYTRFTHQYAVSTYPYASGYDPGYWARLDFAYPKRDPTDSAAAGTALATGAKTRNGIVGMAPDWITVLENAVERAELHGKATGVVTSVYICDATPAAFVAHNTSRSNLIAIAQQMLLGSALDVLMGGGHPGFDANGDPRATLVYDLVGGESTWLALQAGSAGADADADGMPDPWTLIQTRAEFQALSAEETPSRVCGIPQVARTLQEERAGDLRAAPYTVPLLDQVPTLEEMALGALNVLDESPQGFFVMIEGGAVDWASHDNYSGRMLEELLDFDRTVAAVVAWVEAHSNWQDTLLVVTADHETGYLWGPGSNPGWQPLVSNGAGVLPGMQWNYWYHTNSLVPLYAQGAGSEGLAALADQVDPVRGAYLDNAELGAFLLECLVAPPPPAYTLSVPLVLSASSWPAPAGGQSHH